MPIVFTRSTTYATRNSSSTMPPSSFCMCMRLNAVARRCSFVAFGSRSPASCHVVNWSNGRFWLNALMTQSRYAHVARSRSIWYPCVSAYRARSSQSLAIRSP